MNKKPPLPEPDPINLRFRHLATQTSKVIGTPLAFLIAIILIIIWALAGFFFHFTDTWQLIINTFTTIGTFLLVILVQNTQNRDAKSINLKLDELLHGVGRARDSLMEIEEQSDEELDSLKEEFRVIREKYIKHLEKKHRKKH